MDNLVLVDYIIVGAVSSCFIAVGLVFAFFPTSIQEYLHGSYSVATFPLSMSLAACFISFMTIQGLPAEVYLYGVTTLFVPLAVWGAVIAVFLFIPLLHPLKLTSVYLYLEHRYQSQAPKIIGSAFTGASTMALAGISLYHPALTLSALTNLPVTNIIIALSLVSSSYTILGGFRAVVWCNTLQVLFILGALSSVCVAGLIKHFRSWTPDQWETWEQLPTSELNVSTDPHMRNSVWMNSLAMGGYYLCTMTMQPHMMRYTAAQSVTKAKLSALSGIAVATVISLLSLLLGILMLFQYCSDGCDIPFITNATNSYQLVHFYVRDVLNYPGVNGIFIATVVCSSLSTVSLLHNALVSMFWVDMFQKCTCKCTERGQVWYLKVTAVLLGLVLMLQALNMHWSGSFQYQLQCLVFTCTVGSIFGLFLVGAAFPFVGPWAAFIAGLLSIGMCLWISVGSAFNEISWQAPVLFTSYQATNQTCPVQNISSDFKLSSGLGLAQGPYVIRQYSNNTDTASPCPLYDLYRTAPALYSIIGCSITVILSLLLSLIPALRQTNTKVEYTFTFISCMKYSYAPVDVIEDQNNDSETKDSNSMTEDDENKPVKCETEIELLEPDEELIIPEVQINGKNHNNSINTDDVFTAPNIEQSPTTESNKNYNNNVHMYRQSPNPHDPALILANILTRAENKGERDRLLSSSSRQSTQL